MNLSHESMLLVEIPQSVTWEASLEGDCKRAVGINAVFLSRGYLGAARNLVSMAKLTMNGVVQPVPETRIRLPGLRWD